MRVEERAECCVCVVRVFGCAAITLLRVYTHDAHTTDLPVIRELRLDKLDARRLLRLLLLPIRPLLCRPLLIISTRGRHLHRVSILLMPLRR